MCVSSFKFSTLLVQQENQCRDSHMGAEFIIDGWDTLIHSSLYEFYS